MLRAAGRLLDGHVALLVAGFLVGAASCGSPGGPSASEDAAAAPDLGRAFADLAPSSVSDLRTPAPRDLMRVFTGCYGTVKCLNGCGEDGGCRANCRNNTRPAGLALLEAYETCLEKACPSLKVNDVCANPSPACDACYAKAQQPAGPCFSHKTECFNDM